MAQERSAAEAGRGPRTPAAGGGSPPRTGAVPRDTPPGSPRASAAVPLPAPACARVIPGNVATPPHAPSCTAASTILDQNRRVATPFMQEKMQREASRAWDKFYRVHQDRFFKDRLWTDREFAELAARTAPQGADAAEDAPLETQLADEGPAPVLVEVGCGVGNTVYPLLDKNAALRVHCCDFSPRAVQMVQDHAAHDAARVNAFVHDLVRDGTDTLRARLAERPTWPPVSTLSLIFVLSAIPPHQHRAVLGALAAVVPVGGTLVFRDYARCDLAQLRFHTRADAQWAEPSLLSDTHDWYRRGDHTMAYFFTRDEMQRHADAIGGFEGPVEEVVKVSTNRRSGAVLERRFIQARLRRCR
ncbi:hypothetical protein MSPP1_002190 [Malassezia sp. CBS 17886]|nr:hypothetical protein MSPP1_002190 [Malassezia sp. CBS 17886]